MIKKLNLELFSNRLMKPDAINTLIFFREQERYNIKFKDFHELQSKALNLFFSEEKTYESLSEQEQMKLELTLNLTFSLLNIEKAEDKVDEIFYKKPEHYIDLYQESYLSSPLIERTISISKRSYYKKIVGIVEHSNKTGDKILIEQVIKSFMPFATKQLKNKQLELPIELLIVLDNIFKENKNAPEINNIYYEIEKIGEYDYFSRKFLLSYLMLNNDYRAFDVEAIVMSIMLVKQSQSTSFTQALTSNISLNVAFDYDTDTLLTINHDAKSAYDELMKIERLQKHIKLLQYAVMPKTIAERKPAFLFEGLKVDSLISAIVDTEMYNHYYNGSIVLDIFSKSVDVAEQLEKNRSKIFKEGKMSRHIGFYSNLTKVFGLSESFFTTKLTNSDIALILEIFETSTNVNNIDGDITDYFISMVHIVSLIKEIHYIKAYIDETVHVEFLKEKSNLSLEIETLKRELATEREKNKVLEKKQKGIPIDWNLQLKQIQSESKSKDALIQEKNQIIKEQEKEIEKLKNREAEYQDYQEFLEKQLTNLEYTNELMVENFEENNDEKFIQQLTKLLDEGTKIMIVGGIENLTNKLKRTYNNHENLKFTNIDKKTTKSSFSNAETLYFVLSTHCNHRTFYNLQASIKNKKNLFYIGGVTNMEYFAKEVVEALKNSDIN